mmetsp:Transcript_9249/g.13113  ORF Transcript_9249/g.13113 Transcript_9249/m.13113 type:complete len:604 (+) Transcript_9249:124-1935(+)
MVTQLQTTTVGKETKPMDNDPEHPLQTLGNNQFKNQGSRFVTRDTLIQNASNLMTTSSITNSNINHPMPKALQLHPSHMMSVQSAQASLQSADVQSPPVLNLNPDHFSTGVLIQNHPQNFLHTTNQNHSMLGNPLSHPPFSNNTLNSKIPLNNVLEENPLTCQLNKFSRNNDGANLSTDSTSIKLAQVPLQKLSSRSSIVSLTPISTLQNSSINKTNNSNIEFPSYPKSECNEPLRKVQDVKLCMNKILNMSNAQLNTILKNQTRQVSLLKKAADNQKENKSLSSITLSNDVMTNIENGGVRDTCRNQKQQVTTNVCKNSVKRSSDESLSSNSGKHKYCKVYGGGITNSLIKKQISPQDFLEKMIKSRGYSTARHCSLEGGYHCKPTELQTASYGVKIIEAVRGSNVELLSALLQSGLSPNSCNSFGESIVHMACRRSDYKILKLLVDNGACLQVSDDFGRTPLHDACWTAKPCFKSIELILGKDERLLHIVDCRGSTPLAYVKQEQWQDWIEFLDRQKEVYWSPRDIGNEGSEPPPHLTTLSPHSRPVQNPEHPATVEIAKLISSGKLDAKQTIDARTSKISDRIMSPNSEKNSNNGSIKCS